MNSFITFVLFVVYVIDCFVPDPLPFVDEIALFLVLTGRGGPVIQALTLFITVAGFFTGGIR